MSYIGLCVCNVEGIKESIIVECPAWSGIESGCEVVIGTPWCDVHAVVKACVTVEKDSEVYNFVVGANDAKLPLNRIDRIVTYKECKYGDAL